MEKESELGVDQTNAENNEKNGEVVRMDSRYTEPNSPSPSKAATPVVNVPSSISPLDDSQQDSQSQSQRSESKKPLARRQSLLERELQLIKFRNQMLEEEKRKKQEQEREQEEIYKHESSTTKTTSSVATAATNTTSSSYTIESMTTTKDTSSKPFDMDSCSSSSSSSGSSSPIKINTTSGAASSSKNRSIPPLRIHVPQKSRTTSTTTTPSTHYKDVDYGDMDNGVGPMVKKPALTMTQSLPLIPTIILTSPDTVNSILSEPITMSSLATRCRSTSSSPSTPPAASKSSVGSGGGGVGRRTIDFQSQKVRSWNMNNSRSQKNRVSNISISESDYSDSGDDEHHPYTAFLSKKLSNSENNNSKFIAKNNHFNSHNHNNPNNKYNLQKNRQDEAQITNSVLLLIFLWSLVVIVFIADPGDVFSSLTHIYNGFFENNEDLTLEYETLQNQLAVLRKQKQDYLVNEKLLKAINVQNAEKENRINYWTDQVENKKIENDEIIQMNDVVYKGINFENIEAQKDSVNILVMFGHENEKSEFDNWINMIFDLDHPVKSTSVNILISKKSLYDYAVLKVLPKLKAAFHRAECFYINIGQLSYRKRRSFDSEINRRSLMARYRNMLISYALKEENYLFWLDPVIKTLPRDTLSKLLSHNRSIIVPVSDDRITPYCHNMPYDPIEYYSKKMESSPNTKKKKAKTKAKKGQDQQQQQQKEEVEQQVNQQRTHHQHKRQPPTKEDFSKTAGDTKEEHPTQVRNFPTRKAAHDSNNPNAASVDNKVSPSQETCEASKAKNEGQKINASVDGTKEKALDSDIRCDVKIETIDDAPVILIKSEVYREGAIFPPLPIIGAMWETVGGYEGVEVDGICYVATVMDHSCYLASNMKIQRLKNRQK